MNKYIKDLYINVLKYNWKVRIGTRNHNTYGLEMCRQKKAKWPLEPHVHTIFFYLRPRNKHTGKFQ